MTLIAVAGDWHGDYGWARSAVEGLARRGITRIVHVGDFAIGFGNNRQYTAPLNYLLGQHGMKLYITPGNHENYDVIEGLELVTEGSDAGWLRLREHILVAPRGKRWSWENVTFLSMGGGNSIDYRSRTPHRDWWPQESITQGDLYNLEADVAVNGCAEVMIAHVAPFQANYDLDGYGWAAQDIRYSDESRVMMGFVTDLVKPEIFFHGHYHIDKRQDAVSEDAEGNRYVTHFVSMGMNKRDNNIALFDLATRDIEFVRRPELL